MVRRLELGAGLGAWNYQYGIEQVFYGIRGQIVAVFLWKTTGVTAPSFSLRRLLSVT
jgi:hypothetical protein